MAGTISPMDHIKLRLCAQLSQFAYTAGDPKNAISSDNERAKEAILAEINSIDPRSESVLTFEPFYSHSWYLTPKTQIKWFRSYAYLCHLQSNLDKKDRVVVAFRGTWNPGNTSLLKKIFTPSGFGPSDFYYDVFLIRVPYRTGPVWKWYTYWGSLIIQRTWPWMGWPRTVALDWMSRPYDTLRVEQEGALAHLGFWSLWASPEGFAGHGRLSEDTGRVMHHLRKALEEAEQDRRDTEILVTGHSLGGAVSWYVIILTSQRTLTRSKLRCPRHRRRDSQTTSQTDYVTSRHIWRPSSRHKTLRRILQHENEASSVVEYIT